MQVITPPPLALLNYGKLSFGLYRAEFGREVLETYAHLSLPLPYILAPSLLEVSWGKKKFGLLRMGYTVKVWREGHWPKLLFHSLPCLLYHQQLQGSLILQSFSLHNTTPVWLPLLTNSFHLH